jgi:CheY-like chemotaxis protein
MMSAFPRILAVDPSMAGRRMIQMALAGASVESVASARDALQRLSGAGSAEGAGAGGPRPVPDVIVLDEGASDVPLREFAAALAGDPATAGVPGLAAVAEVVAKPLSGSALADAVAAIAERRLDASGEAGRPRRAARCLARRLNARIAELPPWTPGPDSEPLSAWLAKTVITPEFAASVADELAPAPAPPPVAPAVSAPTAPSVPDGNGLLAVADLLELLRGRGRSGTLTLMPAAGPACRLSLSNGAVVRAERDGPTQAGSGDDAAQGREILASLLDAGACPFRWSDGPPVETSGEPLSPAAIAWERLRGLPVGEAVEGAEPSAVYRRTTRFATEIGQLGLSDAERRIAAALDGRATVAAAVERSGQPAESVRATLTGLVRLGLMRRAAADEPARPSPDRPVMLVEADAEVRGQLAKLFRRRQGAAVVSAAEEADLPARLRRERPQLAVLDRDSLPPGTDLPALVREIRSRPETSDILIAATGTDRSPEAASALTAAGCDAVLAKPYVFRDLESLLWS